MDNRKGKPSSTSSSITSQLFGSQDSSSSTDVFASIFPPKGVGRNSGGSEVRGSWQEPSGTGNPNNKQDNNYKHGDANKEKNSIYQQEGGEPCYLSSSIHYGGRESYSRPPTHSTSNSYPNFNKKDGGEDDPNGAARGNWWQGSLYY